VTSSPFYRVGGEAGRPDGEGKRVAGGGSINVGRPIRWGLEMEGSVGCEEGGKYGAISGRGGVVGAATAHMGGGGRSGFWRKKTAGRLTG
jgi:hypothetical protein